MLSRRRRKDPVDIRTHESQGSRHMLARNCAPTEGNHAPSRNVRCNICQPAPQTNLHAVSLRENFFLLAFTAKQPFRFDKILRKKKEKEKEELRKRCFARERVLEFDRREESLLRSDDLFQNVIDT